MRKISHFSAIILFAVLFVGPISALASCPSGCTLNLANSSQCVYISGGGYCAENIVAGGTPSAGGINTAALSPYTNGAVTIINSLLVPLLFAISFIVFLYGVSKTYILSRGETKEVEEGHKLILWGIIGFVVMISIWGLVNLVSNTFDLRNSGAITDWPSSR